RHNFFDTENLHSLGNVEHFGNRRRLFETPASKRARQSRNLAMNVPTLAFALKGKNLSLSINRWMIKPDVEATSPERVADSPLFIGCEHHEWDCFRLHGSELWNAELPIAEQFKQQRL